jgi:hypothetical protein
MKIKAEYIDTHVSDPLTSKIIWCREIPTELYDYYFTHGHENLFEQEVVVDDELPTKHRFPKEKINKDDIS